MPGLESSTSKAGVPFVAFGDTYDIAEGTRVFPLTFGSDEPTPPFETTIFVVEAGSSTPLDKHRVEELWVILEGDGLLAYGDRQYRVSSFDRMVFPSQHEHKVENVGTGPLRILSVYWQPGAPGDGGL